MANKEELEAREDVKSILASLKADPKFSGKRLRPIDTTIGVVVVQNPSRGQYNITGSQLWDDDKSQAFKAMSGLFRMSIVYPDPKTLSELLDGPEGFPAALDEPEAMKDFRRHIGHAKEADQK